MKKNVFVISIFFVFGLGVLGACQSTLKKQRMPTSADAEQENPHEQKFLNIFESYMNSKDGHIEVFSKTTFQIINRAYYYMQEFDRMLEECSKKREKNKDAVCEDPIDSDNYTKLMTSRIVLERQKERFTYYYQRLLDLANSQDGSLPMHQATVNQLKGKSFDEKVDIANFARTLKSGWDTKIRNLINLGTERDKRIETRDDFVDYDVAIELFKQKEMAQVLWSEEVGKEFKPSSLIKDYDDLLQEKFDFAKDARDEFDSGTEKFTKPEAEVEEFQEVYEQFKAVERNPQSVKRTVAWKNHTGRNFKKGEWALTYDDGPNRKITNELLDILEKMKWPATFFWLAQNVERNQEVVNRAKRLGMSLAHHSYTHANLSGHSANLDREIVKAQDVLERAYGMSVNFFRLPYGAGTKSQKIRNTLQQQHLEHFFWNVDSLDWKDPSPKSIYQRIVKQMQIQGRGIILMHDINNRSPKVTKLMATKGLKGAKIIRLEDGDGILYKANQETEAKNM